LAKYKFVGPRNPATDYTSAIILERDADGNVTKSVGTGESVEMSAEMAKSLSDRYIIESSSGSEVAPPETESAPEGPLAQPA
jgi:hypothetical protein